MDAQVVKSTQSTSHECLERWSSKPVRITAIVIGLLLAIAGVVMYFTKVNAIAAYTIGSTGAVIAFIPLILKGITNCCSNEKKTISGSNHAYLEGTQMLTIDFDKDLEGKSPREEQVLQWLKDNPNMHTLYLHLPNHSTEAPVEWNPDFSAIEKHFAYDVGKSSGTLYVYKRPPK